MSWRTFRLGLALADLKSARDQARVVKAPMLLRKIRSAIKSCGGAMRHAAADDYVTRNRRIKRVPAVKRGGL